MSKKLVTHFTEQLADISLMGYSAKWLQDLTEALDDLEHTIESLRDDIDEAMVLTAEEEEEE